MKRPSLTKQIENELKEKLKIGQSRHDAKINGTASEGIYSWKTFKTYMQQCNYFAKWCKENYGCKTLQDCRQYADIWLSKCIDEGKSAYTLKLSVSALCKLYNDTSKDYIETPKRNRKDIKRSRGEKARDKHFSEEKHSDIVFFCKATGLRRHELAQIRGRDYIFKGDDMYVIVKKGKGGKYREVPVHIDDNIRLSYMMDAAGDGLVFPEVPNGMDVHSYRAIYATTLYNRLKRPLFAIPKKDRYYCRGDRKGLILDKRAMLEVSRALGHNRISIIASNYLIGIR